MADRILVDSFKEFYTTEQIRTIWQTAFTAAQERKTEVTVTSKNLGEGNAAGEVRGEPEELMRAAKVAIDELEAEASGGGQDPTAHVSFERRVTRT